METLYNINIKVGPPCNILAEGTFIKSRKQAIYKFIVDFIVNVGVC